MTFTITLDTVLVFTMKKCWQYCLSNLPPFSLSAYFTNSLPYMTHSLSPLPFQFSIRSTSPLILSNEILFILQAPTQIPPSLGSLPRSLELEFLPLDHRVPIALGNVFTCFLTWGFPLCKYYKFKLCTQMFDPLAHPKLGFWFLVTVF